VLRLFAPSALANSEKGLSIRAIADLEGVCALWHFTVNETKRDARGIA
jgi:hypothetical protein